MPSSVLCSHPRSAGRWEGPEDRVIFHSCTCHCQEGGGGVLVLWLCSSGGQLITPVWGLVTGYHQPALCCCQEPFTPSSSSANGTSESIKTIITANPTESKEIILGGQGKHGWSISIYLSRECLDVHLAPQPITVAIFCIYAAANTPMITAGGGFSCITTAAAASRWSIHCITTQILHFDLSWWARAVGWWETEIYLWLRWIGYRPYQQQCFYSHHGLMNRSQHPLNISPVGTSIVPPRGQ